MRSPDCRSPLGSGALPHCIGRARGETEVPSLTPLPDLAEPVMVGPDGPDESSARTLGALVKYRDDATKVQHALDQMLRP